VIGFVREVLTAAATGYLHGVQALDRPADPVDQHAAEVTELLGLRLDQQAELYRDHVAGLFTRETLAAVASAQQVVENALMAVEAQANAGSLEDQIAADTDAVITALHRAGRLREPGSQDSTMVDELRKKVRQLGKDYGRASDTICAQRRELEGARWLRQLVAVGHVKLPAVPPEQVSPIGRRIIVEALGLPADSTSSAIVVAIRGLREAAENPPVVEVDSSQVSLPISGAVDVITRLDEQRAANKVLRRNYDNLAAELESVRETAWSLTRELERERTATHAARLAWSAAGQLVRGVVRDASPTLAAALHDLKEPQPAAQQPSAVADSAPAGTATDPADTAKVGEQLGRAWLRAQGHGVSSSRQCWAVRIGGLGCTRAAGHTGQHVETSGGKVLAVWPNGVPS